MGRSACDAPAMLWRFAIYLVLGGYVAFRVVLAVQIARARRAGDVDREQQLRRRAFGLLHWVVGATVVFTLVLVFLVWANSR
jgi:hypothetical protein